MTRSDLASLQAKLENSGRLGCPEARCRDPGNCEVGDDPCCASAVRHLEFESIWYSHATRDQRHGPGPCKTHTHTPLDGRLPRQRMQAVDMGNVLGMGDIYICEGGQLPKAINAGSSRSGSLALGSRSWPRCEQRIERCQRHGYQRGRASVSHQAVCSGGGLSPRGFGQVWLDMRWSRHSWRGLGEGGMLPLDERGGLRKRGAPFDRTEASRAR